MKKITAIILALIMTLSLGACTSSPKPENSTTPSEQPEETAKTIDTLIVGTTAEITSANRSEYNFDVLSGAFSQLAPIALDEDGNCIDLLCSYTPSADASVWTLTVKDGMTWHDGTPVTAEDIKFTLEYLDTQTEGGYAESYAEIKVVDEKTVELVLPSPDPRAFNSLTTLRIMPKHIYEGIEDYTTVSNELANIGCGPYKFVRFDADAGVIEFSAYENYPDGKPNVGTVLVKLFDSADTMYMALKSGEIDMVYKYSGGVDASVIADLEATGTLTLMPVKNTANSAVLIFNNNAVPGNDINIRKAVASAIDYAKFRELFGSPYSVASRAGFIPDGSFGYIETAELERDLDAAEKHLEAAGCSDSDGDGFVEYKGEKLSIPVMLRDDKPSHARYAELLKNNLAEVGIDVTLDVQEVANFRTKTEQERSQTAVITGLTPFGMAKAQGMASLYIWGENSMGYGQVYDESYKALLDTASAASTIEDYKAAAAELQTYYAENLPAIALFWDSHVQAFSNKLSGFEVDGTFGILNVRSWYSITSK